MAGLVEITKEHVQLWIKKLNAQQERRADLMKQFEAWLTEQPGGAGVCLHQNIRGEYKYEHAQVLFRAWRHMMADKDKIKTMRLILVWSLLMTLCMSVAFLSLLVVH